MLGRRRKKSIKSAGFCHQRASWSAANGVNSLLYFAVYTQTKDFLTFQFIMKTTAVLSSAIALFATLALAAPEMVMLFPFPTSHTCTCG